MMSTSRLLIRRLAATPTLQRIGRREHHLLSRGASWNSATHNAINFRSTTAPVHLPTASFWSWWTGDSKKDDAPAKPDLEPEKIDEDPPPVSQSVPTADSDAGHKSRNEGGGVLPEKLSSEAADTIDAPDEKYDGVPSEEASSKASDSPGGIGGKADADGMSSEEPSTKTTDSTGNLDEKANGISPEDVSPKATDSFGGTGERSDDVPTDEVIAGSKSSPDGFAKYFNSTDGGSETNDGVPLEEPSVETNDPTVLQGKKSKGMPTKISDSINPKKKIKKQPKKVPTGGVVKKHRVVPPAKVIRTGHFKWLDFPKMYGVILQDKRYQDIGPLKTPKVFLHFNEIYPEIRQYISQYDIHLMEPIVNKEQRIQFQARVQGEGRNASLHAFNVRYIPPLKRGSTLTRKGTIPILPWPAALTLMRKAKAGLGHDVYDILSSDEEDEKIMAEKIQDQLDYCSKKVEWTRNQVADRAVAVGCKARLGEEIYDLLSNIATEDNVERKANDAYFRCLNDLSEFDTHLSPDQKEQLKEWTERRSKFKGQY